MTVTGELEIRPGSDAGLPAIVAVLGQRRFFSNRLARQWAGSGVLLVAWLDGRPLGDVFLDWAPADEPTVRRHLPGVPTLTHLEVLGPFQRCGIGTAPDPRRRSAPGRRRHLGTRPRLGAVERPDHPRRIRHHRA